LVAQPVDTDRSDGLAEWPVLICLFGSFNMLKRGVPVALRGGGKSESLLATLALRHGQRVPRDVLLSEVWPEADPTLAAQALNSLVHSLHKLLGRVAGGAVHARGLSTEQRGGGVCRHRLL
jgi:DNA-binding SARP family transcriptional activator